MHPDHIQKLIEYFMRLPGIGPRQASRFVYTLLDEDKKTIDGFSQALKDLEKYVGRCSECFRSITKKNDWEKCVGCSTDTLEAILVVEKDQDLENIAKSGLWTNAYHVLGGTISLLNEKTRVTERIRALYDRLESRLKKKSPIEVVLATSTTTEGDSTALYIERILEPYTKDKRVVLTRLGRGVSTGAEMEYTDPQTLQNALKNRK